MRSWASIHQISRSVEAARLDVIIIVSLWNLTGISAALLPRCLSISERLGKWYHPPKPLQHEKQNLHNLSESSCSRHHLSISTHENIQQIDINNWSFHCYIFLLVCMMVYWFHMMKISWRLFVTWQIFRILVVVVIVDNDVLLICNLFFSFHYLIGWFWHMKTTKRGSVVKMKGFTASVVCSSSGLYHFACLLHICYLFLMISIDIS